MENLQKAAQDNLRRLIDQIERLEEERAALGADIRDKLTEAKGTGFDVKILRKVLSIRRKGKVAHAEEEAVLETYLHAVGFEDTPLGKAAAKKRQATHRGFRVVAEAAE